jgi:hypothetical protein
LRKLTKLFNDSGDHGMILRAECEGKVGRSAAICNGTSDLTLHETNKYRAVWGLSEIPESEWTGAKKEHSSNKPKVTTHLENVGTALARRIEGLATIKEGSGCNCQLLSSKMNEWGIAGCERERPYIIEQLLKNSEVLDVSLSKASIAYVKGAGIVQATGTAIKLASDWWSGKDVEHEAKVSGANWLLDASIEDVKKKKLKPIAKCSTPSLISIPLSKEQRELHRKAVASKPAQPDPFDNPVIHFGAHLWPIRGNWEWHVDRWNEVAETITGHCVVGISDCTDCGIVSIDEVRERLSDRFEIVVVENSKEGENPTFRHLQQMIPHGNNDLLIYAHGKGVRPHTAASESVRVWTEIMYETVVYNHSEIIRRMAEGYRSFGSFRTFGDAPLSPRHRWHYSGTFFAVRAKYLTGEVKPEYGGVEAWCGDHIPSSLSWCEFADSAELKAGYDLARMYPMRVDAQMQWECDRLGGTRCEQHKRELDWFVSHLNPNERILVIGSKHGGLEQQLRASIPDVKLTSVDIAPAKDNTEIVIVGDSSVEETQQRIHEAGPYDVIFIDGDHSYAGVKSDFEFALKLNPRIIALHDIADAVKHRREGCEVDRLWKEIRATENTSEKIVGCGWGGIGIVHR